MSFSAEQRYRGGKRAMALHGRPKSPGHPRRGRFHERKALAGSPAATVNSLPKEAPMR